MMYSYKQTNVVEVAAVDDKYPKGCGVIGQQNAGVMFVHGRALEPIPTCTLESTRAIMQAQGLCVEGLTDYFASLLTPENSSSYGVLPCVVEELAQYVRACGGQCNVVYSYYGFCGARSADGYSLCVMFDKGHCVAVYHTTGSKVSPGVANGVVGFFTALLFGQMFIGLRRSVERKQFRFTLFSILLMMTLACPLALINFERGLVSMIMMMCILPSSPSFDVKTKTKVVRARLQFFGLGETKSKLDNLLDSLTTSANSTNDIAAQIMSVLAPGESIVDNPVFGGLLKLTRVLVNCSMAKDHLKVWNFVFNVTSEFGPAAVKHLLPLLKKNDSVRGGAVAAHLQFSTTDFVDMDSIKSFIGENQTLTKVGLAASLAILLQLALGVPPTTNVESILKYFGDRSRSLNNIVTFGKNSSDLFQGVSDYVLNAILPGYATMELDEYVSGYDKWSKEILSLDDVRNPIEVRIQKDKKLVFAIERLYKKGIEYSTMIKTLKVKPPLVEHYQKCFKIIEDYRKKCDYTGVFGNRPRCKPLLVYLFGQSGVGKSGMTWPLATDLNAVFSDSLEQAKDFTSEIYFRNVEQEFWDGYSGQNIVVYDDFGQRTDSAASANEEFMEVIRTANIAPYPLHMAQIEEKKRTKFVSKVIVLTSNILNQRVSSLTFPDAVFRRVDVCGEVRIKEEFSKLCHSAEAGKDVMRLDRSKCNGPVDIRPYEIVLHDPESKMPLTGADGKERVVSYDEFLTLCCSVARANFEDSMLFNTILEERIDEVRFSELRKIGTPGKVEPLVSGETLAESEVVELSTVGYDTVDKSTMEGEARSLFSLPSAGLISQYFGYVRDAVLHPIDTYSLIRNNVSGKYRALMEPRETNIRMDAYQEIYYDNGFRITVTEIKSAVSEKFRGVMRLKTILMVLGLILAGLGVWKYFSKRDVVKARYPDLDESLNPGVEGIDDMITKTRMVNLAKSEASSSGDNSTMRAQRVQVEASSSGDNRTRTVPRVSVEASSSGDNLTLRTPRTVMEASSSGDSVTKMAPRIATEAFASGDSRTQRAKRVVCEAAHSGDSLSSRAKRVLTEGLSSVPGELQGWEDRTAGDLISHRVLSNLYKIRVGDIDMLNGLFIRDRVMLTPRHLLSYLVDKTKNITIRNCFGSEFTLPIHTLKFVGIRDSQGRDKDAVLIQFPNYVNAHSDLVKHFQLMPELQHRSANVCLPTIRVVRGQTLTTILGNTQASFDQIKLGLEDGSVVHIRDSINYRLNTVNGDCGAPVIVNETSVLRKIAGIHIAAAMDGTMSYGQSVTRRDLDVHLAELEKSPIITDLDLLPNFTVKPCELQFEMDLSEKELVNIVGTPAPTFGFAGYASNVPFSPSKTDIRPSVIHGYTDTLTKPAYLYVSGEHLMHRNLQKCALNTPYIPETEVDRAVKEVESKLLSGSSSRVLKNILTFEDAISGNDSSEYISGINRRTSPGYPWILERQANKPGKTGWLGEDEYIFDDGVRAAVEERIAKAKLGIRCPTVWTDTLKDERRPIEKVESLKTRVFSHGPFDYTIAFRMYFLSFIAHIMENRITNEQSLGTNVYNKDWSRTYSKLQQRGRRVFAGDFSTFDGTLNSCIMSKFVGVANRFYNDGPENARIREVLMLDIFNSVHLCDDVYYICTHSQPSGNPLTTVLNSFYNSVSMRIAFYRVVGNDYRFEDHVSMVSYGDDNVVNISDVISKIFNQNSVTEAYATFGMIYTDEAKTGGATPDYRNIDEVAYLKRGFIRTPDGFVRAPMSLDTIMETPQWIRSTPEAVEACLDNIQMCVAELAQHPREVFVERSELMLQAFYTKTGVFPEVGTFEYYLEKLNSEYNG